MAENTGSAKADDASAARIQQTTTKVSATEPSFDMDELRELMELVNEQGFAEFEFENENIRIRLGKNTGVPMPIQTANYVATAGDTMPAPPEGAAPHSEPDEGLHKITSPIVGTFYRSPGPDKEPYVKEGTSVTPDSVVCIVEAMKLMNEIQAEVSGEVVKVYVENGQPVEFGQPLFGIRK